MFARSSLRIALHAQTPSIAIGVHDPLSARLAAWHGFDCLHIGSFGLASRLVVPDVGLLDLTEILASVADIAASVDIPLIVDAEDGFHQPAGIARAVARLERAGAAAIHIEDHISGKHTSGPRRVATLPDMLARIHAALDARVDPELVVIARTDIGWATQDAGRALERMQAFAEAGADAVMPTGLDLDTLRKIRGQIPVPVIAVSEGEELSGSGTDKAVDLWIHHDLCVRAAANGVSSALANLAKQVRPAKCALPDRCHPSLENLVPYAEFSERHARYAGDGYES